MSDRQDDATGGDLLTIAEVAAHLRVSRRHVLRLIDRGAIPVVEGIGGVRRIPARWLRDKVTEALDAVR